MQGLERQLLRKWSGAAVTAVPAIGVAVAVDESAATSCTTGSAWPPAVTTVAAVCGAVAPDDAAVTPVTSIAAMETRTKAGQRPYAIWSLVVAGIVAGTNPEAGAHQGLALQLSLGGYLSPD